MTLTTKILQNGFTMPAIGKGTWMAGTKKKTYHNHTVGEDVRIDQIKNAISNGVTYIDSAERYANGYGEEILGKAIKHLDRKKLFLTSKLSSKRLTYDSIILAAKRSIKRMGSEYLDLYFIHHYDKRVSLKETMRAMDYLIEKKMVRYIGVCNFTSEQITEAQSHTKNRIIANQVRYNFMSREAEKNGVVEYCQKNDIMIIAWRPFSEGLLTKEARISLEGLAQKHGKTISQIANAWLMQQKNVVVLAKLSSESEVRDTTDALTIRFDKQDIENLKKGGIHDK